MISALEKLASRWEKEAGDYHRSAAESGLVDGAHPDESTDYQRACALQAGVYQTCAHQLRELIRKNTTNKLHIMNTPDTTQTAGQAAQYITDGRIIVRFGSKGAEAIGKMASEATAKGAVLKLEAHDKLVAALKRAVPWLGKLIADGAHLNSVAPNDAIGALQQAESILSQIAQS